MTWVVPLALIGLAIAVMSVFTVIAGRRGRHPHHPSTTGPGPRVLVHDINDDRCTGCDACVAVCPTNVLDLVNNKSRVLRFHDCIQCEACMWACPTEALVMFPEGNEPPALKVPELDPHYMTAIPGQYLIGEVAGKPLVKNAANLGRAVVEHMIQTGIRPGAFGPGTAPHQVDVAIVGSGPAGLSAALSCIQRGLTYVVLEKEQLIASTVARYPKGKLVMAEPYDTINLSLLPVFDSSKEQIVPIWRELIERTGVQVRLGEAVESVMLQADHTFDIRTTVAAYRAQRVVLATGMRGKPRTLQVPGENLAKVTNLLDDPDEWRGREVLVVGGGDSAVEAALALADAGARVIVSYRGKSFSRAAPKNKQTIESYAQQQRLKVKYESQIVGFEPDAVTLQLGDGAQKRYANHAAFVLIGADPPVTWLEKLGVRFVLRPHQYALGRTDELVRRLVPRAGECPQDAAGAAAVIGGSAPERMPSQMPTPASIEPVSGPRKWVRAATSLFGVGEMTSAGTGSGTGTRHKKIDAPMPLSEFAKRQRTGVGREPRDQLSAGERTRVLRMLRDEGGRIADDESRVAFVDMLAMQRSGGRLHEDTPMPESGDVRDSRGPRPLPGMAPSRAPMAPPPRPSRSGPITAPPPNVHQIPMAPPPSRGRSAPMTAPPSNVHQVPVAPPLRPTRSAPVSAPPPPVHQVPRPPAPPGDIQAKPAVIVGLAQAHASGPRGRGRPEEIELGPGVRMKPGRAPRPEPEPEHEPWSPEVPDMPFDQLTRNVPDRLPRPPERPAPRQLRRAPPGDYTGDVPTRAAPVDPRLLADTGEFSGPEDATRMATGFGAEHDPTSAGMDLRIMAEHLRPGQYRRPDPDFDLDDDPDSDVISATLGDGAQGAIDLGPSEQSRRYARLDDNETPLHDLADTGERGPFRRGRPPAADEATRSINAGRTRRDWENE